MNTDASICSQALIKIGADQIDSLLDDTVEAKVANAIYKNIYHTTLASYHWSFATAKYFSESTNYDPDLDLYVHQLPADFVGLINLVSESNRLLGYDFYSEGTIAVPSSNIEFEYLRYVHENELPEYFVNYLVNFLAAEFCLPITENTTKAEFFIKIARDANARAKLIDGQQFAASSLSEFPLTTVRGL